MNRPLKALIATSVLLAVASMAPFALAASSNSPGSKCAKVGSTAKSGSIQVKCVKSGSKLVWQKVAKAKVVNSPTPIPSAPSSKPTASQSASAPSGPTPQNEYQVNARGTTWSWSFSYSVDGSKTPLSSDATHKTILYLPQGKLVHIDLKSNDVSHGFWVPGLGIDKEASPDLSARLDITPEKTGTFPGACNIQCGRGHAGMTFTVIVVTQADYLKYLSTLN